MFTPPAGDRADVANFAVLITDGASDNSLQTISEAFLAKRSNIHFVVIGIGKLINIGELYTLANYPDSANYLSARDVSALSNLTQTTLDLVCNSKSTTQYSSRLVIRAVERLFFNRVNRAISYFNRALTR